MVLVPCMIKLDSQCEHARLNKHASWVAYQNSCSSVKQYCWVQNLWIAGFEAAAKHSDKIIQLVDIMAQSGCPCFTHGQGTISALRRRIYTSPDDISDLLAVSIDAWTTRQYDYYQCVLNGIL